MYGSLQAIEMLLENEYQKIIKCVDSITGEIYLYNIITNKNIIRLMDVNALNDINSNIIKCFRKDEDLYILMRPHDVNKQFLIKKYVDTKKLTLKKQYSLAKQVVEVFVKLYNFSDLFQLKVINFNNLSVDENDILFSNGYLVFESEFDLSDNYTYKSVGNILHYIFAGKEVEDDEIADSIPPDIIKIIRRCLTHEYFHPKDIIRELENSSIYSLINTKADSTIVKSEIDSMFENKSENKSAIHSIPIFQQDKSLIIEKTDVGEIFMPSNVMVGESVSEASDSKKLYYDNAKEDNEEMSNKDELHRLSNKHGEEYNTEPINNGENVELNYKEEIQKTKRYKREDFLSDINSTKKQDASAEDYDLSKSTTKVIKSTVDDLSEIDLGYVFDDDINLLDEETESGIYSNVEQAGYYNDDLFIENNRVFTADEMKDTTVEDGELEEIEEQEYEDELSEESEGIEEQEYEDELSEESEKIEEQEYEDELSEESEGIEEQEYEDELSEELEGIEEQEEYEDELSEESEEIEEQEYEDELSEELDEIEESYNEVSGKETEQSEYYEDEIIDIFINKNNSNDVGEFKDSLEDYNIEDSRYYDEFYDNRNYDDEEDDDEDSSIPLFIKILIPLLFIALIVGIIFLVSRVIKNKDESINSYYASNDNTMHGSDLNNTTKNIEKEVRDGNQLSIPSYINNTDNKIERVDDFLNEEIIKKIGYDGYVAVIDNDVYCTGNKSLRIDNDINEKKKDLFCVIDFSGNEVKLGDLGISSKFKSLKDDSVNFIVEVYKNNELLESSEFEMYVYSDTWTDKEIVIDGNKVDRIQFYMETLNENKIWIDDIAVYTLK